MAPALMDPSNVGILADRRSLDRLDISDSETGTSGGFGAVMVGAPVGIRPRDPRHASNSTTLTTGKNGAGGGVPVSTAVLAAILSAILATGLCIAFYKYGFSHSRVRCTRSSRNESSKSKPRSSTKEKRRTSLKNSRILSLPENPFQANPFQPRIQERSYDEIVPVPDPATWMRPISLALKLEYQARKAEANNGEVEDGARSPIADVKTPLSAHAHFPLQSSVSSSVPMMSAAMAPNTPPEVTDVQFTYPPGSSKRPPHKSAPRFNELVDPIDTYPSECDGLPHSRSQSRIQSNPLPPPRLYLFPPSPKSFLVMSDNSSEPGELNLSDFLHDFPDIPQYTSQNQQSQVPGSPSMTSLNNRTPFFPSTSPPIAERLSEVRLQSKGDPRIPLPLPYFVEAVHTFPPSLPDEMEVVLGETLRLLHFFPDGWCLVQRTYSSKAGDEGEEGEVVQMGMVPAMCLAALDGVRTANQNAVQPGTSSQGKSNYPSLDYHSGSEYTGSETGTWVSNLGLEPRWSNDLIAFPPTSPASKDFTLTKGPPTVGQVWTHSGLTQPPVAVVRPIANAMHLRSGSLTTLFDTTRLS